MMSLKPVVFTLSLFLLFSSHLLVGQTTYAPLGSFWNYRYASHNGNMSSNWTIKVTGEDVIDGIPTKTLSKIFNNSYSPIPPDPAIYQGIAPFGILKIRNDSVFFFDELQEGGTFLFSFNMTVEDTIKIYPYEQNLIAVVEGLSTIDINGNTLKKWELKKYCHKNYFGDATIIENIGPIDDYLLWNSDGCQIGGGTWEFQCYSSTELNYNDPCSPVSVGTDSAIIPHESITLFPNPTQDELQIMLIRPLEDIELKIINLNMQVVYQIHYDSLLKTQLNLAFLPPGQYYMQLNDSTSSITKKIIKLK